jgi:hypothetical protein
MARQFSYSLAGRRATAPRQTWRKVEWIGGMDGQLTDCTPAPGNTYTKLTFPPRGRGRGESLTSGRRIAAKLRAHEVLKLRMQGYTFARIARMLGFRDGSGPYRAMKRTLDRIDWDRDERKRLKHDR